MATTLFQNRSDASYGTAITKFNASEWDAETRMLYLMGRRPSAYHEKYKDTPEWNEFLTSQNLSPDAPVEKQAMAASAVLASRIMDEDMVARVCDSVRTAMEDNPDREFSSVRITCPFPVDPKETGNTFAPALTAAVTVALEDALDDHLREHGMDRKLEVVAELGGSREESILNVVNNERATTSDPAPGEEVALYMQRLIRQPVYTGPVDEQAIYVPVDDFLVSQSTMTGLMNYVQANGGVTTPAVTGFRLFNGVEVMEPRQATLDLLNAAIADKTHEVAASGGEQAFRESINSILQEVGLHIDFEDPSKTNLSNAELLFVAGYFADGDNPRHQDGFKNAMEDIGGSVEEARGNSAHDIFDSPPGSLQGLRQICEDTLPHRKTMQSADTTPRIQQLAQKGMATQYQGAAR